MRKTNLKHSVASVVIIVIFVTGLWHLSRTPSNDRDWSLDQQVLAHAEIERDMLAISNIRNFTYHSTSDYTPNYYDKTFNLQELESIDYIVEPFGNKGAAHTFLSFGFKNGDYLSISVEIRKEVGESFSPLKGLFRNYEVMYVIADERDVVKLRSNYRKDDVYIHPLNLSPENRRALLLDMLHKANQLREKPEFYNTFTNNCTTAIAHHLNRVEPGLVPWDYRLIIPEDSDLYFHQLGVIDNSAPIQLLRERNKINDRAEQHADSPDFSRLIREG